VPEDALPVDSLAGLVEFRRRLRGCLTRRGDALFGLVEAMLCAQGPVRCPAELSLEPEFGRGYGCAYGALAHGRIEEAALRRLLVAAVAAARPGQPPMFAIDTTPLARPDSAYADDRTMVLVRGKGGDAFLPGYNYSILLGIGWGASSWVDPVQARRLHPDDDHTEVTLGQIRGLLADLAATGGPTAGAPPALVLLDSGNDPTALAHELLGEPVQLLVRLNSKRVFRGDPEPRPAGKPGAPARHGRRLPLDRPHERPAPDAELLAASDRHGKVLVQAWHNMHQELGRSGHWADWPPDTELPIVRGTVIRVSVERLPGGRKPTNDIWLFHAAPSVSPSTSTCCGRRTSAASTRNISTGSRRSTSGCGQRTCPQPQPPTGGCT
jgi:DDE superfamily endonuclease